jgi:citrate lyase beta subunit
MSLSSFVDPFFSSLLNHSVTLNLQSLLTDLRPHRHILYASASELPKLSKANQFRTLDTAVFDLEDGVPPNKKDFARKTLTTNLSSTPTILPESAVRINSLSSLSGVEDPQEAILNPTVTKLIKLEDPDEFRFINRWLTLNNFDQTRVLDLIETPLGLTRAYDFCCVSSQLDGFIFGAEDFRSASGISLQTGLQAILFV